MEHATPGALILLILFLAPVLYFISRARRGQSIFIRRIPGIDAVDEAVGRAVELGRPVAFTTGLTGVGPTLYACLGVLRHVSGTIARFGSRLFVPVADPETLVLTEATVQEAYRAERRLATFDPASIRFLSSDQFAFASGYMGLIQREDVKGAFLFGTFAAESLILAEAGQRTGAIQVAATVSQEQIPFFITSCDYTLIGEELYVAGAYLSRDPVQTGSLRGQDFGKMLLALFIGVGIVEATYRAIQTGERQQSVIETSIMKQWGEWSGEQPASGAPS